MPTVGPTTSNRSCAGLPGGLPAVFGGILGGVTYALLVRPWQLCWGATSEETRAPVLGDDLIEQPEYVTTRAVAIQARPEAVWPWIVQIGQGRGGFYTYDRLEQLIGAAIRSSDHILPEFQQLSVGDTVRLSPAGGPTVAILEPGRALVLHDVMDLRTGRSIPTGAPSPFAIHWTWSFSVRPVGDNATRLVVRTRAAFTPRLLCLPASILVLEPVHFFMERGMLLGIKQRAERLSSGAAQIARVRSHVEGDASDECTPIPAGR
jgi:hypothetical protein